MENDKKLLSGLMGKPKDGNGGKSKSKSVKRSSESFTLTIQPETIQKFNEIQWLKQYAIDFKRITRDEVLNQALDLLAESINYDELMKQYGDKMKGDISPPVGRKSKR